LPDINVWTIWPFFGLFNFLVLATLVAAAAAVIAAHDEVDDAVSHVQVNAKQEVKKIPNN